VGARIRTLRTALGLSQEALGERARLSYKFVGEVERGRGNPTLDTLNALATALGVTLARLVADDVTERSEYPKVTTREYLIVREARDSLDSVLERIGGPASRRRRR